MFRDEKALWIGSPELGAWEKFGSSSQEEVRGNPKQKNSPSNRFIAYVTMAIVETNDYKRQIVLRLVTLVKNV